jgi:glycosyltransferase involved in cell wall biosynthesis
MNKKICIISPGAYPLLVGDKYTKTTGGAEAQLTVIGQSLAEQGYDINFLVGDFEQSDFEQVDQIKTYKVPLRYMGGSNIHIFYDWIRLLSTLLRINADIHIIKLPRNLLAIIGLFCKFRRKKLIFVGQIDTDVELAFLRKVDGLVNFWLYRIGIKQVDYVIAQNEIQKSGFKKTFNREAKVIKNVITLPINSNYKKENYILWVGSSLQKKQPEKFIELAKMLPDLNFKMIVSSSSEDQDNIVQEAANKEDNIEFLGFVPFNEIRQYFGKAKLFISTSLREGFPNTFLQSWQYGTPVVSLNVDPDGVIEHYQLGRLSKTMDQMTLDIKELVHDIGLWNEFSQNSKKYVNNYHSRNAIVKEYIDVFDKL